MRSRWLGCSTGLAGFFVACVKFGAEPGPEEANARSDASNLDAGADAGGTFEGFESALPGCGMWTGVDATVMTVDGGRTGRACRVCSTKDQYFHLRAVPPVFDAAPASATIILEAYVQIDSATDPKLQVSASFVDDETFATGAQVNATSTGYQPVSMTLSPAPGHRIEAEVSGRASGAGACFLVDDIRIVTLR